MTFQPDAEDFSGLYLTVEEQEILESMGDDFGEDLNLDVLARSIVQLRELSARTPKIPLDSC
jgi:hypothetical protein